MTILPDFSNEGSGPEKPQKPETIGAAWAGLSSQTRIVLVSVVAVAGLALIASAGGSDDGGDAPSAPKKAKVADPALAPSYCEDYVKDRLKAPRSAEFNDPISSREKTDGTVEVVGTVDADNSFGAQIRSTYVCTVKPGEGGVGWDLVSMVGPS